MNANEYPALESKMLKAFDFATQQVTDLGALRLLAGEPHHIPNSMILVLRSRIYGEEGQEYLEDVPASWWAHFRLSCFPRWANRRWPPKMRAIRVKAAALCPTIRVPVGAGSVAVIVSNRPPAGWTE